jgi:hypothetical protein
MYQGILSPRQFVTRLQFIFRLATLALCSLASAMKTIIRSLTAAGRDIFFWRADCLKTDPSGHARAGHAPALFFIACRRQREGALGR